METTVKQRIIEFIKYKGISQSKFEKTVGLSNGFINNISKGIGADKLHRIICNFPELNQEWLLTGSGDMVSSHISQENVNGDNIQGNNVTVHKSETDKFLDLLKKKDEQIDRLLTIIEKVTK